MDQATRKITKKEPPHRVLSRIVVGSDGKLAYADPPVGKVLRQMLKDFPVLCWYMLLGMVMLFSRALWAILHRQATVMHKIDLLIYSFLLFVSGAFLIALVSASYYLARTKLKAAHQIEN